MERGDKNYHLRNYTMERELVSQIMEWYLGQFSMSYSLGRTAQNNLVSPSMVDACRDEFEQFHTKPKYDCLTKPELKELKDLCDKLHDWVLCAEKYFYEGSSGHSGWATWLMTEDEKNELFKDSRLNMVPCHLLPTLN